MSWGVNVAGPVLRRELLERWRSRRATLALTGYLTVLGLVLYLLYRVGTAMLSGFGFGGGFGGGLDAASAGPLLGRFLLEGLLFFVLLLVLFVSPGYAAAQLSGERERRTLQLLQVTLLSPWQIVLGKLGAATAWLTLLVVAVLPLGAGAFFLGGVGVGDLLRGTAVILVVAVGVAAMALGISSLTKRTTGSIVFTYGLVLGLVAGTLFVTGAQYLLRSQTGAGFDRENPPIVLYANPFFGLADAVRATGPSRQFGFGLFLPSPLGVISEALPPTEEQQDVFMPMAMPVPQPGFTEGIGPGIAEVAEPSSGRAPVWLIVMAVYAAGGAAGLVVATRRVRVTEPGSRRARSSARQTGPPAPVPPSGATSGAQP